MMPAGVELQGEHPGESLQLWAPAKVNLYLEVLRKRPDGYHEIATAMGAINLLDRIRFTADGSGRVVLHCTTPGLAVDDTNLVVRAARLLRERTGCRQGARIELVKRIPMAAGLAGGSSDAATTLL